MQSKTIFDVYSKVKKNDPDRNENDLYPTPPLATYILHKYIDLPHNIVEPTAGRGNISIELIRNGYNVQSFDLFEYDNDNWPNVRKLMSSVITNQEHAEYFILTWLLSVVASAYGNKSELVLVFCGEKQGTGKTHWFRYLLPKKIRYLYAESKMDAGKDDEILMTKKIIILDDEYGGKSKREEKRLKEITSKM